MKQLLLILFLLPLGLMAQENKSTFGIKGGFTFANSNPNIHPTTQINTGFALGGFANRKLGKVFSLQAELLFSKYGYEQKNEDVTDNDGNKLFQFTHLRFSKLELPLSIKATSKTGVIKPFVSFGASPGINIGSTFQHDSGDKFKLNNVNAFSLSLIPGFGISIKDHFIIDARYSANLTKQYSASNIKVNTFYLTLAYAF